MEARRGTTPMGVTWDSMLRSIKIPEPPVRPLVITTTGQPVSLIKSVSMPAHEEFDNGRPIIQDHAVLTVVHELPRANELRPAYTGADKSETLGILVSDIDYSRLATVPALASTPQLADVEHNLDRVLVTHNTEWTQRDIHAANNASTAYGAYLYDGLTPLIASLAMDGPEADKEHAMTRLVQHALDLHGILLDGGVWYNNGGHNVGRKLPYLVAAKVLDHASMLSIAADTGANKRFQDDQQTFHIEQSDVDNTLSPGWEPDDRAPAQTYSTAMVGLPEWCIRHHDRDTTCNYNWGATYRNINAGTSIEQYVVMRLMGLEADWNYDAYGNYQKRAIGYSGTSEWAMDLYDTYLETSRPGSPTGVSITNGQLTWDEVANAAGYEVLSEDGEETKLNYFTTTNSLDVTGWAPGTYEVQVIAFDADYTYGHWSAPATVTP